MDVKLRESFREELRDAVAPSTLKPGLGAGLICLAFIVSYLGAFHAPKPDRLPIAVVAPAPISDRVAAQLNSIPGSPVKATAMIGEAQARNALATAHVSGVFVLAPGARTDRLLVATGGGVTVANAVQQVVRAAERAQHRAVAVTDVVPRQDGDTSGGSVFYVMVGCLLAGYLLAASISEARGARPASLRRTLWRLGMAMPYSASIGVGAAVIADPVLGVVTGHFGALVGIGTLLVFVAAATTIASQVVLGFAGVAVAIIVFVVLGNPSAGGVYPYRLLPPFWRDIGPWLPNGAGVDVLRRQIYFGGAGIDHGLLVLGIWAAASTIVAIGASWLLLPTAGLKSAAVMPSSERTPISPG